MKQQVLASRGLNCLLTVALAIAGSLPVNTAGAEDTKPPATSSDTSAQSEFVATALAPFWRATEIREPLFFIRGTHGEPPKCQLLFKPKEVLSVRSATREKTFEPGKDYNVDLATGTIELPAGSKIPVTTKSKCIR